MSSAKPGSVKAVSSAESGSRNGDAHIRKRIADLTAMLAKLDEHAAALAKERARVAAELSKLLGKVDPGASVARRPGEPSSAVPKPTDAPDAPPAATKAATKDARGRCAAMCIEDIDRIAKVWSSSVACIALGDACAALLFDSAPPVFSTNFEQKCPQLHAQLASRAEDMPRAVFLAIGTEERFYTRFADGKQEWVASEECTADVKLKPVSKLAFGRDWEDYFILYKDGSCKWAGIPPKLAAKLQQLTPKSPPVANVTLGPDGEWFIGFADGTWEMGGCSDALGDKVAEIVKAGSQIKLITFGENDAWVIRYNKPGAPKPKLPSAPAAAARPVADGGRGGAPYL